MTTECRSNHFWVSLYDNVVLYLSLWSYTWVLGSSYPSTNKIKPIFKNPREYDSRVLGCIFWESKCTYVIMCYMCYVFTCLHVKDFLTFPYDVWIFFKLRVMSKGKIYSSYCEIGKH